MTAALPPAVALCRPEEITEGEARPASVTTTWGETVGLIIVRWGGAVRVFKNWCPHAGTPLDWAPGMFWNTDRTLLLCATHGAQFEPDTGFCLYGPCRGKRLELWPTDMRDGVLHALAG
ncbi:MAG: Rieske (2Fe-2S) protein [Alphaproteobacteria bacterium]|nr:MAG: Rieske (2Fe-2S) protein [Alphaproteobacteria bacterium]